MNQNNAVSTVRMTEVAADPTNQLALEAAVRRRQQLAEDARSTETVRLCAVQRVVRAQLFEGPRSFAHVSLLGMVMGGRDRGSRKLESAALIDVLHSISTVLTETTAHRVQIALSDFDGGFGQVLQDVSNQVLAERVTCSIDRERQAGRGYNPSMNRLRFEQILDRRIGFVTTTTQNPKVESGVRSILDALVARDRILGWTVETEVLPGFYGQLLAANQPDTAGTPLEHLDRDAGDACSLLFALDYQPDDSTVS